MGRIKKIGLEGIKGMVRKALAAYFTLDKGPVYEIINKKNSTYGNISTGWNGRNIKRIPENVLYTSDNLNEGIDWQAEDNIKGGIIVFSTDVNAVAQSQNKILNWCKTKLATFLNRLKVTKKIDAIAVKHNLVGWTIGHFLDGRYTAKNGKTFGENSLSVEVIGVDTKTLISIAEDICRDFKQECVLCKDYSTTNIYFVNPQ